MRTVIGMVLSLVFVGIAFAQTPQPDPSKNANQPWPVDQRCGVMGAHLTNQGVLTSACLPAASGRPYINQEAGPHQSQTQRDFSVEKSRPRYEQPTTPRD